ncbi:MAG: DUF1844 domain-containing protein [Planctomycetaceae bacterium]|nr:DUF1844 domain-containing protein [Planctomycetaceae bacterium]
MADSMPVKANFTQFINGFAVQTLVHLGKMSNPMTGKAGVDLANAKYSIDILGILQEKTKGNLTSEEEEYLSNLLRDLRMEYVTVMNEKPAEGSAPAEGAKQDEASS